MSKPVTNCSISARNQFRPRIFFSKIWSPDALARARPLLHLPSMPRKRGTKRNKNDEVKLAAALRKFRRAQEKSKAALQMIASISHTAVTEINRDQNRRVAPGLEEDSSSESSSMSNGKVCFKKASKNAAKAAKKTTNASSRSRQSRLTVRTAKKKSRRAAALKTIECNVNRASEANIKASQKAEAAKELKKSKRKCAFEGKLLPGGKTVPLQLQAEIVNKILQQEQRSIEAGQKVKRELTKKHKASHPGVHRQSANNWLKRCRGAPAGTDITILLRNRAEFLIVILASSNASIRN